jgi:AcrR family transcriptional regulator
MDMVENTSRPVGRPRDEEAGPAILEVARRLVLSHGYCRVSIALISKEAGVGRQTLYRRWVSKADLVLDAFFASASENDSFEGLPFELALRTFLETLFENLKEDGPAIRNLIASAQSDLPFCMEFRERFVEPRAEVVRAIFERGLAEGQVREGADVALAIDVIHGAFWYRLLQGEALDESYAKRLATFVARTYGRT